MTKPDIKEVRTRFNQIRGKEKVKAHLKVQEMADFIYDILSDLGSFYTDGISYYFFDTEDTKLYNVPLKKDYQADFSNFLMKWFRFPVEENKYGQVYQQLLYYIRADAKETTINKLAYYDQINNVLYISNHNNGMFVIDTKYIREENNGYNEVFFRTPHGYDPIIPDMKASTELIDKLLFDKIWFSDETDDTKMLFKEWFYSLFFGNIMYEKPLMILQGSAGCGKTSTLVNIGQILQGKSYGAVTLSEKETDFLNMLFNNIFLVIDNLDGSPPSWFVDKITAIATGGYVEARRLYTSIDAQSIKFKPETFISLTTRTPAFNRDDLASRSIIGRMEKPESETGAYSTDFRDVIINNRSVTWGSILKSLQQRLINISKDKKNYKTKFRMVEFTNLCIKSNSEALKGRVKHVINNIENEQAEFNLEDNPTFELLQQFVANDHHIKVKDGKVDTVWSTTDLLKFFKDNEEYKSVAQYRNAIHLGRSIGKIITMVKKYFYLDKIKLNGITHYDFGSKGQPEDTGNVSDTIEFI